jgi:hypothetical protein
VLTAEGTRTLTARFQGGALFEASSDTESHQVIAPNQPPSATNDSYNATAGVTLNVNAPGVLANDQDPNGDQLTATVVSGPDHGTLNLNPDGGFSYTPSPGFFGGDEFTYEVSAGGDTDTATVEIIVTP